MQSVQNAHDWLQIIYDLQPEFTSDTKEQISGWIGVWSDVSALRRLQRKHVEVEREHAQQADRSRQQQEQFIDITFVAIVIQYDCRNVDRHETAATR
jgi:hypothetical protein